MPDPVRSLVLQSMKSVFEDAVAATTGGGTLFQQVQFELYDGDQFRGKNVLALLEGPEVYEDFVSPNKRDRTLDLELDCHAYIPLGTEINTGANEVLADMEELVEANERWGGNAIHTFLQSNLKEVLSRTDRTVEVSLFIRVRYRTNRNDPRT